MLKKAKKMSFHVFFPNSLDGNQKYKNINRNIISVQPIVQILDAYSEHVAHA